MTKISKKPYIIELIGIIVLSILWITFFWISTNFDIDIQNCEIRDPFGEVCTLIFDTKGFILISLSLITLALFLLSATYFILNKNDKFRLYSFWICVVAQPILFFVSILFAVSQSNVLIEKAIYLVTFYSSIGLYPSLCILQSTYKILSKENV